MASAPKRILVCGGRAYGYILDENGKKKDINTKEVETVYSILDFLHERANTITVISGAADGADTWAIEWAKSIEDDTVDLDVYPADWEQYGKAAGFIRNKKMLDIGKPDIVVAFSGGKGTKMMCEIARKAGVKVFEVENNNESKPTEIETDL